MSPELHPDVLPLAFLLGVWEGNGTGDYPTTQPFSYRERIVIDHVGKAFLSYEQQSWSLPDGEPLHFEHGFLRPGVEPGTVELSLAHPLGLTETAEGELDGNGLRVRTGPGGMGRTATGSPVTKLARRFVVEGDVLRYELDMATEDIALTHHVASELRRVGS
jgi:hypothetical protein